MEGKKTMGAKDDVSKNMSSRAFGQSAKKQKGKMAKLLLSGPEGFHVPWPVTAPDACDGIMDAVIRSFKEVDFRVLNPHEIRFLKTKKELQAEEDRLRFAELVERRENNLKTKKGVVFGVNEVTKGLEKNLLKLVIVDRSTRPSSMVSHLPALAANRGVAIVSIPQLGASLSTVVGISSVVAIGYKVPGPFDETVKEILARLPAIVPSPNEWKPSYEPGSVKVLPKDDLRTEKIKSRQTKKRISQLADSLSSGFPNKRLKQDAAS